MNNLMSYWQAQHNMNKVLSFDQLYQFVEVELVVEEASLSRMIHEKDFERKIGI